MNMNFNCPELADAWKENRIIILPVPLGTEVWRVRKTYMPKEEKPGWEIVYVKETSKYDLTMFDRSDIYFSMEEAQEAIERLKNET